MLFRLFIIKLVVRVAKAVNILIDHNEIDLGHTLLVDLVFRVQESLIDLLSLHSHRLKSFFAQAQDGCCSSHNGSRSKESLFSAQDRILANH